MNPSLPPIPIDTGIVHAVAALVDDAGATRQPSHSEIADAIRAAGALAGDPHQKGSSVGTQKRVRATLRAAAEVDDRAAQRLVRELIDLVRTLGGFREDSPNYCGQETIRNCRDAFANTTFGLTADGRLRPRSLDALSGRDLTDALRSYAVRAQSGHEDSVLVAGTDKDIIEATAKHVLRVIYGTYDEGQSFALVLGQAFAALGLKAQRPKRERGGLDGARDNFEAQLYDVGIAVNRCRNKGGAGHGRPFIPDITGPERRSLTEAAGLVAGRLLDELTARV